jgi:hypothetical protein
MRVKNPYTSFLKDRKWTMKTISLVSTLILVLFIAFATTVEAQISKEGTTSNTCAYSSTFKALPMGQERLQMTYELMGVIIGDTSEDLFHNSSWRCLGALHAVKGEYNNSGFCVATRPDKDQIFWTYKTAGKLGVGSKGTWTYVGGTGKLTGIQGNGEVTDFPMRPAAEGTFQGYARATGQYKLP